MNINESVKMAKCGLTTLSKCRTRKANLPECDGCKFVLRRFDRWKMIDKKPHKKCLSCGKFLPVNKFYVKKVKKPGRNDPCPCGKMKEDGSRPLKYKECCGRNEK